MTQKRMIDADKNLCNLRPRRNLRSDFRRYRCLPAISPVLKIEHGWTRKEQIRTDSICENLRNLRSDFH